MEIVLFGLVSANIDESYRQYNDECGYAYKTTEEEALGKRSIAWTNAYTADENKAFLRSLLPQIPLQSGDLKVLLAHGSPLPISFTRPTSLRTLMCWLTVDCASPVS